MAAVAGNCRSDRRAVLSGYGTPKKVVLKVLLRCRHENGVLSCGAYLRTPCRPISDRPLQDTVLCGVTPSEPISVEGKKLVVSVRR